MNSSVIVKALAVWLLIAAVEMLHGITRARLLAPRVGDLRSRQIGVFTGSVLFYLIAFWTLEWVGPATAVEAFVIGAAWTLLMVMFEFSVGHFVFQFPWKWLFNDFNLLKGRLLAVGMVLLFFCPYWVGRMKALW